MPAEAFTIKHGRHRHYEFWMFDQKDDYYRRHLMLHEFTHCFMTCECGMIDIPPLWYLEGMAEFFATHQLSTKTSDSPVFGILPDQFDGFEGWGRISEFRRSFVAEPTSATPGMQASGAAPEAPSVQRLAVTRFSEVTPDTIEYFSTGKDYCGSWAVCWFLNRHPAYAKHFEPLRKLRRYREFLDKFHSLRSEVEPQISVDWLLFQESLQEGFDVQRSWAQHAERRSPGAAVTLQIAADQGWQDTGVTVGAGQIVSINCDGQCAVNDTPIPWISEPQGISIDYVRGQPLGRIVAILVSEDGTYLSQRLGVGRAVTFQAPVAARLWMQVNDACDSRDNNSGMISVTLESH